MKERTRMNETTTALTPIGGLLLIVGIIAFAALAIAIAVTIRLGAPKTDKGITRLGATIVGLLVIGGTSLAFALTVGLHDFTRTYKIDATEEILPGTASDTLGSPYLEATSQPGRVQLTSREASGELAPATVAVSLEGLSAFASTYNVWSIIDDAAPETAYLQIETCALLDDGGGAPWFEQCDGRLSIHIPRVTSIAG
jgi:hypothetical protein